MNKNESKYFNTAIKMDEALLSLLEKKDFSYITVKEICDAAGVNRSTFYLHYQNTSELLAEATKYILDKHFAYYDVQKKEDVVRRLADAKPSELIFLSGEYLTPYLTFIKENQRLFKLAIKQFHLMNMNEVYGNMFRYIFEPILSRFNVPERERPYRIKFYLCGVFSIVMQWLEGNCQEEMDFIVRLINDCVLGAHTQHG